MKRRWHNLTVWWIETGAWITLILCVITLGVLLAIR